MFFNGKFSRNGVFSNNLKGILNGPGELWIGNGSVMFFRGSSAHIPIVSQQAKLSVVVAVGNFNSSKTKV